MAETLTFTCSICGEPSESICVYCTKDTCPNHLCERCFRCSDCCECNFRRQEAAPAVTHPHAPPVTHAHNGAEPAAQEAAPEAEAAPLPPETPQEPTE